MQSFQPQNRLLPMQNSVVARRNPNLATDTLALLQTTNFNKLAPSMEKIKNRTNKRMVKDAKDETATLQKNRQIFDQKALSVKQEMEQLELQEDLS